MMTRQSMGVLWPKDDFRKLLLLSFPRVESKSLFSLLGCVLLLLFGFLPFLIRRLCVLV